MGQYLAETVLASAVAQNGTFTVPYGTDQDAGAFQGASKHYMYANQASFEAPKDFTVSFGASSITVTYKGATTLPAGTKVRLEFGTLGSSSRVGKAKRTTELVGRKIDFGAPDTADADGICASQAIPAAGAGSRNGALAANNAVSLDVPRNVVAAWTGTTVLTITGYDEYGNKMVEKSASGTSHTGKKAFKRVTQIKVSADVTGATVGTGDVLGLPIVLPQAGMVVREEEDGVVPTAGTLVAGVSAQTATSGDLRGTYDPNSAANGTKVFSLLTMVPDEGDIGGSQYTE